MCAIDSPPCLRWWYTRETNTYSSASCGGFCVYPDSELLEELLWTAIREADLEERFRAAFTLTKPLWYGFWMESPLTAEQCDLLVTVFSQIRWRNRRDQRNWELLQQALDTGRGDGITLEVSLAPPRHADFEVIFAHCPRCKAEAEGLRWVESYPEEVTCWVCGLYYSPAATAYEKVWEESAVDSGEDDKGWGIRIGSTTYYPIGWLLLALTFVYIGLMGIAIACLPRRPEAFVLKPGR